MLPFFAQKIGYLKANSKIELDRDKIIRGMIAKRDENGGIVRGFHGTSISRAKIIKQKGFQNYLCEEGGWGVYFWDEKFKDNCLKFAQRKAEQDKEKEIAVIEALLFWPEPDWYMGRPQWICRAEDVIIKNIKFQNPNIKSMSND